MAVIGVGLCPNFHVLLLSFWVPTNYPKLSNLDGLHQMATVIIELYPSFHAPPIYLTNHLGSL